MSVGNAGESYTPSEDITLYARWTIATYTINYELDGGSVATPNPTSYTIETPTFELNNPTKENYHFVGWTEGDNNTLLPTVTIEQGSTGNLIYKAHYGINNFTVGDLSYQWTSGTEVKVTACNNSATSVTIPATVTNEDLTYSVTAIGITAFYGCNSLTSIEIPSSVTSIGEAAFLQCTSLTSITIPSGVKSIGDWTFNGCNSLKSIEIPEGVTSIGESAFFECTSLTSITIPSSVMSIGEAAFRDCTDLESISVVTGNARYYSGGNCLIETESHKLILGCENSVIPYGVTSIGEYAFEGCTGLASITIPSSVTSIGIAAFEDCTSLASIEIPASVTSIDYEAFMNCTSLTSIDIPSGVTNIGDATFYGCTSLASIEIPASVTSIGDWVFQGCTDLESISVASGNARYHSEGNCIIETESHTLIQGCKTTVIPDDVTTIGGYAFQGCTGLTSIKIPASVSSISVGSFYGCSGLESVTVESENTTYDSRNNCNAIIETETNTLLKGCVNTVIPDDVTTISRQAFKKIPSLTSIEIPASVTSIGNEAFQGCSLTSVTIYAPSLTTYGEYAFDDNAEGFKIYVFSNCLNSYKAQASGMGVDENDILPIENINLKDNDDNSSLIAAASGNSLKVKLEGRTLYKDGDWNTLCLPFDVSTTSGPLSGDNVEAMVLDGDESGLQGTTLTLNFDNAPATIPAGTPFIIRWGTPQNNLGTSFTDPVFSGVTVSDATNRDVTFSGGSFKGTYKSIAYDDEDPSILFLGTENTLYWPKPTGDDIPSIGAFRAYFDLGTAQARQFVLNFGDAGSADGSSASEGAGVSPVIVADGAVRAPGWYTLDGLRFDGKPTKKGLYIHGGKKVVVP